MNATSVLCHHPTSATFNVNVRFPISQQEISAEILAHWMDLINVEGWIPREQILGLEARSKVRCSLHKPWCPSPQIQLRHLLGFTSDVN